MCLAFAAYDQVTSWYGGMSECQCCRSAIARGEESVSVNEGCKWVLAVEGGQNGLPRLGQYVGLFLSGVLTVKALDDQEVLGWREEVLGTGVASVPTLFRVTADGVRVWTGTAMLLQLGRLLGPKRAWRAAVALGALAQLDTGPASPRRRRLLRHGLTGLTAAAAVLANGTSLPQLRTLAQEAPTEGEVTAEGKVTAEGGGRKWEANEVTGKAFDRLRNRAMDDRNFTIIRDFFAKDADWEAKGRAAFRVTHRGNNVRKTYSQNFKRKGESKYVNVLFGVEDNGKDWSRGYVWRGGDVTNEYYVQNGNLRNDGGRVTTNVTANVTAEALPFDIDECDIDHVLCSFLVGESCIVAGASVLSLCETPLAPVCLGVAGPLDKLRSGCGCCNLGVQAVGIGRPLQLIA